MEEILAQKREFVGKKLKSLRKKGFVPAILYGPEIFPSVSLQVKKEDLEEVVKKTGPSSMINLNFEGKKYSVLIHEIQRDPITEEIVHVDFFQPSLKEEIEARVPLVFEGVVPAVKQLGGVLVKNLSELEIKGRIDRLPKEIKVNVESLKDFNTVLKVRDLTIPEGVKVLRNLDDIIALVSPSEAESEETKPKENTETNV